MERSRLSRRRFVLGTGAAVLAATSGCVTTDLSVRSEGIGDSDVFADVSLLESWTANQASTKVTLTKAATTDRNVRNLAVVNARGSSVWSGPVEATQTSVSNVTFPVGAPSTLSATNGNEEYVDSIEVRVVGNELL